MQNDLDNVFLRKAKTVIDVNPATLPLIKFGNVFPFLIPLIMFLMIVRELSCYLFRKIPPAWFLPQIEEFAPFWIIRRTQQIIDQKLSDPQQTHAVDLLQLMLNSSTKEYVNDESKVLHRSSSNASDYNNSNDERM